MKFVRLKGVDGSAVFVNPGAVTHVAASVAQGGKRLFGEASVMFGTTGLRIDGEPEDVVREIERQTGETDWLLSTSKENDHAQ